MSGRASIGARPSMGVCASGLPARVGVLTRFTLRSLAQNRVRTAVTVCGIALAAGLLAAVLVSLTSLQQALIDQTRASYGVWQAKASDVDAAQVQQVYEGLGEHLDRAALRRDLGAVALSAQDAATLGASLEFVTGAVEQDVGAHAAGDDEYAVVQDYEVVEGRLPERAGEVALPSSFKGATLADGASEYGGLDATIHADGALELGSVVSVSLGRRYVATEYAEGGKAVLEYGDGNFYRSGDEDYYRSEDAESADAGASEDADAGADYAAGGESSLAETMEQVEGPRELVVVGFVDGSSAYVADDEPDAACGSICDLYYSTVGYGNDAQVTAAAVAVGASEVETHGFLLLEQGLSSGDVVWGSLKLVVALLVVVICVAAVSLISNAFGLSIAERTRQFGLLSSLGATRRQLRRSVFVEAAVLGAAGVPLGVGLGVAGAWAAFALTGEGWAALVGTSFTIELSVAPWALWVAVALSLATLGISAWIPARRAGRVSAVGALRQSIDVRPPRSPSRHNKPLLARCFGAAGLLAGRSLTVAPSKGRVAAASLAVSVMLVVTAGSLSDYLGRVLSLTTGGAGAADLCVTFSKGYSYSPSDAAELGAQMDDVAAQALELEGVEGASWAGVAYSRLVRMGDDVLTQEARDALDQTVWTGSWPTEEGYASGRVYWVDDDTWERLASDLGLEGEDANADSMACVVVNSLRVSTDADAQVVHPIADEAVGKVVELPVLKELEGYDEESFFFVYNGETGEADVSLGYVNEDGELVSVAPDEAIGHVLELRIVAVADELPEWFPVGSDELEEGDYPVIVMPVSAALASMAADDGVASAGSMVYADLYLDCEDGCSSDVLDELQGLYSASADVCVNGYENIEAMTRQSRAVTWCLRVFMGCFVAVSTAIAVANVFNTVSSSLMLRRREFAVLRSVGMSLRDLRRMVLLECAVLAARGLAGGLALGLAASFLLWCAGSMSLSVAYSPSWTSVLAAFALVSVVLAVTAAYGLRRSGQADLIGALRSEAL